MNIAQLDPSLVLSCIYKVTWILNKPQKCELCAGQYISSVCDSQDKSNIQLPAHKNHFGVGCASNPKPTLYS